MSDDGSGGAPGWASPGAVPPQQQPAPQQPGQQQPGSPQPPQQQPRYPGPQQQSPGRPPSYDKAGPAGPPQGPSPGYGPPRPGGWGPSPYGPGPARYAEVKPGVIPLRPLSLMEILDGSIATARRHPKVTFGLSAAVVAVATLVSLIVTVLSFSGSDVTDGGMFGQTTVTGDELSGFAGDAAASLGVTVVTSLVAQVILTGILTAVMGRAVLGRPVVLGEVWREVRPRLRTLLGLTLSIALLALLALGLVVGLAVLVGWATATGLGIFVGLLLGIGLVVLAVWFAISAGLAGPAIVLEKQSVRGGIRRSFRLVKGSFWRVFGVLALVQIVATLAGGLISVPFVVFASLIAGLTDGSTYDLLPQLVSGIGQIGSGCITYPIVAGATALLYVDLRMRREGLDLELARAARAQASGPGPVVPLG